MNMAFSKAVAQRLFDWSLSMARMEVKSDFVNLKKIQNPLAFRYLEIAKAFNMPKKRVFAAAMVKRYFQVFLPMEMTLEETHLVRKFINFGQFEIAPGVVALKAAPSQEEQYLNVLAGEGLSMRLDRKIIRSSVKRLFGQEIGELDKRRTTRSIFCFAKKVNDFVVLTVVDTGGQRIVGYSHSIVNSSGAQAMPYFSFLSALGISSMTDWSLPALDEGESAVATAHELAAGFLQDAPNLFKDVE
ncbi:MAG TPA: hypothetical protein VMZ25_00335 [Terriglobales bacterium]|nr:hypothetical protein [Terriglobales bacterium]